MIATHTDITEHKRAEERLRSLTGQLLTAQEEERRRIARDLHDDITQRLAGLMIEIGLLRRRQIGAATAAALASLQEQAALLTNDLRGIAHEIHPGVLEHAGLRAALEGFCAQVSRQREVTIRFSSTDVPDGIPQEISVILYRIAQEAVGNAVKHVVASLINLTLTAFADPGGTKRLRLAVTDNGKGFLIKSVPGGSGLGLLSIEERVHLVKGTFAISSAPGEGCRVDVEVPLP